MTALVQHHEAVIRLASFLGVLLVMLAWERAAPRRRLLHPLGLRWFGNLGIVALNTVVLRLTLPLLAAGTAVAAEANGWGLLQILEVPGWIATVVAVVALDLVIYLVCGCGRADG